MTKHLEAPFSLDRWDPIVDAAHPVAAAVPGGPDAGVVELAKTYTGPELVGTATGHALTTRGERGASYVAQERIVGTSMA